MTYQPKFDAGDVVVSTNDPENKYCVVGFIGEGTGNVMLVKLKKVKVVHNATLKKVGRVKNYVMD